MTMTTKKTGPQPWTGILTTALQKREVADLSDGAFRLLMVSLIAAASNRTGGLFPTDAPTPNDLVWYARLRGDYADEIAELQKQELWEGSDNQWRVAKLESYVYLSDASALGKEHAFRRWHGEVHVGKRQPKEDCARCQQEGLLRQVSTHPEDQIDRAPGSSAVEGLWAQNRDDDVEDDLVHVIDGYGSPEPCNPVSFYNEISRELALSGGFSDPEILGAVEAHASRSGLDGDAIASQLTIDESAASESAGIAA